jgi:hypothetical protein
MPPLAVAPIRTQLGQAFFDQFTPGTADGHFHFHHPKIVRRLHPHDLTWFARIPVQVHRNRPELAFCFAVRSAVTSGMVRDRVWPSAW